MENQKRSAAVVKNISVVLLVSAGVAAALSAVLQQSKVEGDDGGRRFFSMEENTSEAHIEAAYVNFMAKYGKIHATREQTQSKYQVFKENYKAIEAHNSQESKPFEMEVNMFADLSEEEFEKEVLGRSGINLPHRKAIEPFTLEEVNANHKLQQTPLPDYVNWYTAGKVSRPYNQLQCGSCWAFSAAAALESLAVISGFDATVQEYSVQQLLDCNTDQSGCGGGWMWEAFNYTKANGIMLRSDYPRDYSPAKQSCMYDASEVHYQPANLGMIEQDRNLNSVLKSLVVKQPISIAMVAVGVIAKYKNGIVTEEYLKCSSPVQEVNHGVLLVGYGKVAETDRVRGFCHEYWIIRNSWGANWGEEGFFRVCMDGLGTKDQPFGPCLVNKYATWPNLDGTIIQPV